jgi:hypothetical protein
VSEAAVLPADRRSTDRRRPWFLLLLCLGAVVAIQIMAGAYRGERGTYPDEAAHFMNGLLVRDYVYDGLGQNPLEFARDYYGRLPKIAPGMWPPFFHVTLGVFLLPGWPPAVAAVFLVGLFAAWAAWRLNTIVTQLGGPIPGVVVAGLFLLTPMVVSLSSVVMVDVAIAALALEATYFLALFFRSGRTKHAAIFGVLTACCCLTKGNGVAVVLVPFFLILLTGQYAILRRLGLYLAASIVVLLAVPFLFVAVRLGTAIEDYSPLTTAVVIDRILFYSSECYNQLGPLAIAFAIVGAVASMARGLGRTAQAALPLAPALTALAMATLLFHVISPHTLSDERYMTLAIAPLLGLAAVGARAVAGFFQGSLAIRASRVLLLAAVVLGGFLVPAKRVLPQQLGYRHGVDALAAGPGIDGKRILVTSDALGEGAMVAEVARRRSSSRTVVVRGSKLLASDDWMGRNATLRFDTETAVLQALEDLHVDYLAVDWSVAASDRLVFRDQVVSMIVRHGERLEQIYARPAMPVGGPARPITVYRLKYRSEGPPQNLIPPPVWNPFGR